MKYEYFCLICNEQNDSKEAMKHTCFDSAVLQRRVPTRWDRFCNRFWTWDITYFLAFSGALAINIVFTEHFNYSFKECMAQGLGLGLFLGRFLKYGE
jgi:hypothetical protein